MSLLINRNQHQLHRRQPQREIPRIMLNQNPNKPLNRTINHPMHNNRPMLLPVLTYILRIKALRHLEIQLNRTTLPRPPQTILNLKVNLRTIEGTITLINLIVQPHHSQSFLQISLRPIPVLNLTQKLIRSRRQLHMIRKTKLRIHLINQTNNTTNLINQLLRQHKYM